MTEADAFLNAIFADPENDLPRLVYADWLEEHGHETYAEFIRLDCLLEHRETLHTDRRRELRERRHRLRQLLREEWRPLLPDVDRVMGSGHRGLFGGWRTLEAAEFIEHSPKWWPWVPVESVTLLRPDGWETELASAPYLSRLKYLELGDVDVGWRDPYDGEEPLPDAVIRELARVGHFNRLQALWIGPIRATRASLESLASALYLDQLGGDGLRMSVLLRDDTVGIIGSGAPPEPARSLIETFLTEYGDRLPTS